MQAEDSEKSSVSAFLPLSWSAETATFTIPTTAPSGSQTVSVIFPGPPGQGTVTFSLANAFRIP